MSTSSARGKQYKVGIIACMSIKGVGLYKTQTCMPDAPNKKTPLLLRESAKEKSQHGACLPKDVIDLFPIQHMTCPAISTSTAIPLIIQTDVDGILKAATILLLLLHGQGIPGHHLKGLLDVGVILGADLEIGDAAAALAVGHGALGADGPLVVADIDLVAEDDEGEGFRVAGRGLDEEFVAPRVERLEGFGRVDVVHEHAAVGAAVEGHAERLEPFLACRVPELRESGPSANPVGQN